MTHKDILPLALMAILLLTACSNTNGEKTDGKTTDSASTSMTEETISYIDHLPDTLDFGGYEVRNYSNNSTFSVKAEDTADIINDLIYKRNRAIEERLNVTITHISYDGNPWEVFVGLVENSIMAGSDDFDILNSSNWVATPLTFSGMLYNINDAPYLELDAPWWAGDYIDGMSYKNSMFWITGPLDVSWVSCKVCNFVNLKLWNNLHDENIYDIVNAGKWTMDFWNTAATEAYQDLNGNGKVDASDQLGYVAPSDWCVERNAYACGIMVAPFDDNGVPHLQFIEDPAPLINFWEKMYALESNTTFFPVSTDNGDTTSQMLDIFSQGKLLFADGYLTHTTSSLRGMEDDYGILPFPKYDESQENYISVLADSVAIYALPKTISDTGRDASLAVMEAAAAEGYNTIIPAYYEEALKNKYIRDTQSIEIINMLSENPMSDFGAQYLELGFYSFLRYDVSGANIASVIQRKSKTFQKTLERLLTSMEEAE